MTKHRVCKLDLNLSMGTIWSSHKKLNINDNIWVNLPTRNVFVSCMYLEISTKISFILFLASPNNLRGEVGDCRPFPSFLLPPSPASTAGWWTAPDIIDAPYAAKNNGELHIWICLIIFGISYTAKLIQSCLDIYYSTFFIDLIWE